MKTYEELVEENRILTEHLDRFKRAFITSQPEKYDTFFVCGTSGTKDDLGLPDYLLICPSYGMDGICRYKKDSEYSAPGW